MEDRVDGVHETHTSRSIFARFSKLADQMSILFRKEIELAKAEASEKVSQVGSGVSKAAIGAVLMIPALVMLLHSLAAWLDQFGLEARWGYLLIGAVVAVIGYAVLQSGTTAIKSAELKLRRTTEQLHRDADVAKEQFK